MQWRLSTDVAAGLSRSFEAASYSRKRRSAAPLLAARKITLA
jgi:hypothetical protein